jgi:hypothetical protein
VHGCILPTALHVRREFFARVEPLIVSVAQVHDHVLAGDLSTLTSLIDLDKLDLNGHFNEPYYCYNHTEHKWGCIDKLGTHGGSPSSPGPRHL